LEAGMVLIDQELVRQTIHFSHRNRKEKFAQVAHSICYDPPMAELLGEIFDIIGEYGVLDIRSGSGRELEREYVEGMYWKGKLLSRQMITDPGRSRADVEDAFVLISDCTVEDPRDLLPVVTAAVQAKGKAMFIVAKKLSDVTIHLLTRKETKDKLHIIAAEIPGSTLTEQAAALQDLAILTGGRPIVSKGGQTLRDAKVEDLGRVRRAWADSRNFGISGGHGDRRKLREYIAQLRQAYPHLEDADKRKSVLQRIGKLLGGSATLWVGGTTRSEVDARKELADRTARAMRGAVLDGVLPGGGVALLNCRPALQKRLEQSASLPERAAYNILLKAVEAPIRTLLANAGYEPSSILGDIFRNGDGCGFDLQTGQIANMTEAGIFDVASVQRDAVRTAISSAALALTVDVVVHRKKPTVSFEP
jgi:chaperonin GroEL